MDPQRRPDECRRDTRTHSLILMSDGLYMSLRLAPRSSQAMTQVVAHTPSDISGIDR